MKTVTFVKEFSYTGNKAAVPVRLTGVERLPDVRMTLDTGSEVSLLNRRFMKSLGVDLMSGEAIEIMVANGEIAKAWIHPIEVEVFGARITIDVAFCPDWDTQNLLGMRGFFDQMVVAFDHANRRIYV